MRCVAGLTMAAVTGFCGQAYADCSKIEVRAFAPVFAAAIEPHVGEAVWLRRQTSVQLTRCVRTASGYRFTGDIVFRGALKGEEYRVTEAMDMNGDGKVISFSFAEANTAFTGAAAGKAPFYSGMNKAYAAIVGQRGRRRV